MWKKITLPVTGCSIRKLRYCNRKLQSVSYLAIALSLASKLETPGGQYAVRVRRQQPIGIDPPDTMAVPNANAGLPPSTEELLRYSRAADLQALQQVPLNVLRAYCHQQLQCAVSDGDFKDAAEGEDIRVRATTPHTTTKQADLFEQQKAETQARDLLIGFMAEDNVSMETLNKIQSTEFLSKQVSHH